MQISDISIAGYRSLRAIRFPVGRLTVFVGANGVGKTNLYRSLQLLQAAAAGTLARELASEGGMESVLWAGKRASNKPVRIKLAVGFAENGGHDRDGDAGYAQQYAIEIGLRTPTAAAFPLEPQVKEESLTWRNGGRTVALLERKGPSATARNDEGKREPLGVDLLASETALGALLDPTRFPALHLLRRTMLDWRFYHDAFPGARLVVPEPERTASFGLVLPDYPKRVFEAGELSDGTLRYLALAGALLAYRLPAFIALNEPETSLHPDLLDPLARLIARAAQRTQIWVVTHSERLADAIARHGSVTPRTVIKRNGETWIEGLKLYGEFADEGDEDAARA
jgi:predicted ATPase